MEGGRGVGSDSVVPHDGTWHIVSSRSASEAPTMSRHNVVRVPRSPSYNRRRGALKFSLGFHNVLEHRSSWGRNMLLKNVGAFSRGLFSHEGPSEEQMAQVCTYIRARRGGVFMLSRYSC